MIKKYELKKDVVTLARERIKNCFQTAKEISFSVSGGKDSICLNDLIFQMCQSGEIDKNKLEINFIDEEAIYPCIEEQVKKMRLQWLSIGVKFNWWCIQVKHYNCLNQLSSDESFICWDKQKKDVWVREMPKFAIKSSPLLVERKDTYQHFLDKYNKGKTVMIGVRCSESLQRLINLANRKQKDIIYPIYDWRNTDVWNYIRTRNLEFPNAYLYMFQVGKSKKEMRCSQFFSIDTMPSLVQMCEFYPSLFDKICKREPNAYMAMLYYDTELYRRKKGENAKDNKNYKEEVLKLMKEKWRFETPSMKRVETEIKKILVNYGAILNKNHYKTIYEVIIGGDPKLRTIRGLLVSIGGTKKNGK